MAILRREDRKIAKKAKTFKQYKSYFDSMRKSKKQPMTYYHWKKSGRTPTYFKGTEATRPEARLRRKKRKTLGLPD